MRAIRGGPAAGLAAATPASDATLPERSADRSGFRRRSVIRRGSALACSGLAAVLLAGCAGEGGGEASVGIGSSSSASVVASAPATSQPAEPTPPSEDSQNKEHSQSDEDSQNDGTGGAIVRDEEPGDGSSDGGTEGLPGWPIESTPVHGARLWAAYLAVGAPGDPALQRVLDEVRQLWPGAGLAEFGCDEGAAQALGRDPRQHAVAVYFASEQHITEFRRRWDGPYVDAVEVTISCAD